MTGYNIIFILIWLFFEGWRFYDLKVNKKPKQLWKSYIFYMPANFIHDFKSAGMFIYRIVMFFYIFYTIKINYDFIDLINIYLSQKII